MSPLPVILPPLPTRLEVAAYCNASACRVQKVTVRMVKWWQEEGWIKPHPAYQKPVRYPAKDVLNFLDGKTNARRAI